MMTLAAGRTTGLLAVLTAVFLVTLASAVSPMAEVEPQLGCPSCQDYDACTVDSCDTAGGTCRHDPIECDDGNPCTSDICGVFERLTGCRHPFLSDGTACDDEDPCTAADACDGSGRCAGEPQGLGSTCDDGNACTTGDTCGSGGACAGTPLAPRAECDDRDTCTLGERCAAGPDGSIACQASARNCDDGLLCTTDSCDPISGDCVNAPVDCNDGNPCTVDACDPDTGACTPTMRTGACDDRNVCTVDDFCSDGNCLGGGAGNCGWGGQCGSSTCIPSEQRCLTNTSPTGCPSDQCNRPECRNGFCAFVQATGPCSDGNPCTLEMCVRGGCVVQLFLTGACDDGSACTSGEICQTDHRCTGTPVCSDGDACTDDLCDAATGACLGTQPKNCDDGNPCTNDSCDPATGCRHNFNSDPCDDSNACTTNDQCSNGFCRGTPAVTCPDDGNPCTSDECDRTTGACVHRNNFASCDDGNPCTLPDFCKDGSCHAGDPKFCSDFNACTEDSCEPTDGSCLHRAIGGPCTDGNACTAGDTCVDGTCRPGAPPNCDDGNACTSDGCSNSAGCFHTLLTGSCDDGNPCTTGDACSDGACRPKAPVRCIDGNACTIDFCDRATGACVHQTIAGDCDDGNACTVDLCDPADGACLGTEPVNCDDAFLCTVDACDPASGCTHLVDQAICPQEVIDVAVSFSSPFGKGSGTLRWRTTYEWTLGGFNIVVESMQGNTIRLNDVLIPCTECATGRGAPYEFIVPKHRSGRGVFVELIGRDGAVLGTFGPAEKVP